MQNIRHFSLYTPTEKPFGNVRYLISEDGRDWYQCAALFSPDTVKFCYDSNGTVKCITRGDDFRLMWPVNMSVAELPAEMLPEKFDISGRWKFDGEQIIDTLTREEAMARKMAEISAWRDQQENTEITFELNGHRWDAGYAARNRLAPVLDAARAGVLPAGFYWTDADNNDVTLTTEELEALDAAMVQAMVQQGFRIHEQQRRMKQAVEAMTAPDDILAFEVGRETGLTEPGEKILVNATA